MRSSLSILLFGAAMGALAAPQKLPGTCDAVTVTSTVYITGAPSSTVKPKPSTSTKAASSTAVVSPPAGQKAVSAYRNTLYFTNWGIYGANTFPESMPLDALTHILYAFADISSAGEVISSDTYADFEKQMPNGEKINWSSSQKRAYGCIGQLNDLKRKNRNLKVILSIGGWTYSQAGKFRGPASTDAGRKKFADSAVKLMTDYGMDGLDIDWEYPENQKQGKDYVLLLRACRVALDNYAKKHKQNYRYELSVAASAGPSYYNLQDLKGMDQYLDVWNIMTYDFAGGWDSTSGHQSNVFPDTRNKDASKFDADRAIRDYIAKGIAPSKISFGIPLYGRAFANTQGIGKPFSGLGKGTIEPGVPLWKDLPRPGAKATFDSRTGATWSYDANSKELVSFDGPKSANFKANYLKNKGLGGSFFWDASGDKKGDQSLVRILAKSYQGKLLQKQNMLSYPESPFANIKGSK